MQKFTPNLWFDDDAEPAVDFYTDVFDDASIGTIIHVEKRQSRPL